MSEKNFFKLLLTLWILLALWMISFAFVNYSKAETASQFQCSASTNPFGSSPYDIAELCGKAAFLNSPGSVQNKINNTGTINFANVTSYVQGVLGTTEQAQVNLDINGTDHYLGTLQFDQRVNYIVSTTTLSVPVTQGDTYYIQVYMPAWVTSPTAVFFSGDLIISNATTSVTSISYASSTPSTYAAVGGIGYLLYAISIVATVATFKRFFL